MIERWTSFPLELLTIDVQTPEVYTSKGVPVKVDGVAQIKVRAMMCPSRLPPSSF